MGAATLKKRLRLAASEMAKGKREERAAEAASESGDYEFKLPTFDEKAFMRREIMQARASFWTVGIGTLVGLLAAVPPFVGFDFKWGWLIIGVGMLSLAPILKRAGFGEEVVKPKALFGSYFMLFFTALSVWILVVNFV